MAVLEGRGESVGGGTGGGTRRTRGAYETGEDEAEAVSAAMIAEGRVGFLCGRGGGRAEERAVGVALAASSSSSSVLSSSTDWKDEVEREGLCLDGDCDGIRVDDEASEVGLGGREGRGGGGPLPLDRNDDVSDAVEVVRLSPERSVEGGLGPGPPTGEKRIMSFALRSGEPSGVAVWRDSAGPRAELDRVGLGVVGMGGGALGCGRPRLNAGAGGGGAGLRLS